MNFVGIRLKRKKSLIGLAVVAVLLIVFAVLGWQAWLRSDTGSSASVKPLSADEALAIAMSYSDRGDIKGGLEFYDNQIREHKDSNEKQQLLVYKSDFALKAGRYDDAVGTAKQADAIKSNTATMTMLARAYEGQGNKQKAVSYYKKLLNAAPKDGMGSRPRGEWEQKIQELES
jgi:tetratricopeptide (TPR) repeat protein